MGVTPVCVCVRVHVRVRVRVRVVLRQRSTAWWHTSKSACPRGRSRRAWISGAAPASLPSASAVTQKSPIPPIKSPIPPIKSHIPLVVCELVGEPGLVAECLGGNTKEPYTPHKEPYTPHKEPYTSGRM